MPVYRQKIIYRKIVDGIDTTEIILPKIINTDIGFELQFGFSAPKDNSKPTLLLKEYKTPKSLQE
tara:strand:+ start:250 stop:444 length:195 start_codon:yes stop_codon:yes gene_type:complete